MSSLDDRNNPWNDEQAPFAGAETPAEVSAATAEAAAAPEPGHATTGAPYTVPPTGPAPGAGAYGAPYGAANSAAGAAGWRPVGGYARPMPPPPGVAVPVAIPSSGPNPALAFFLGLIPGVGAMYNGQVAKGFIHLIVFAVLVTIAQSVDVFGIFVAGWIAFMAFEAYNTAKARRDGLPLPNAFGWNDIGERIGLGKNWPGSPGAPGYTPQAGAPPVAGGQGAPPPPAGWANVPPVQQAGQRPYPGPVPYVNPVPNWAGYVPPAAFPSLPPGAAVPPGYVPPVPPVPPGAVPPPGGQGMPYAPVHGSAPYATVPPVDPTVSSSRLPVGAIWLIGLGVLFLLGQWTPLLHWSHVWVPSLILGGLAVFLFARRMGWTGSPVPLPMAALPVGLRAAIALRMPGALMAIAILNGLDQAWVVRWHHSWPVLLIVIGGLMLAERAAWRQAALLDPLAASTTNSAQQGGL